MQTALLHMSNNKLTILHTLNQTKTIGLMYEVQIHQLQLNILPLGVSAQFALR